MTLRSKGRTAAEVQHDVLVIGTGFGGAVTAARLAERGMRVLALERGPWWGHAGAHADDSQRRPFPQSLLGARRLLRGVRAGRVRVRRDFLVRADGLLELYLFDRLSVGTASGVGGGSLIYGGLTAQPEADFFEGLPAELTPEELRPYYARVQAMLRPGRMPEPSERNVVFEQAVTAAGLPMPEYPQLAIAWGDDPRGGQVFVNAAGELQTTAPHAGIHTLGRLERSKTTLDLTYVAHALRQGAEVRALTEALAVAPSKHGYDVHWIDHRTGQRGRSRARRVVIAAGTLGTLRLLFAARDRDRTLPHVSSALGRRFSPNGDVSLVVTGAARLSGTDRGLSGKPLVRGRLGQRPYAVAETEFPLAALRLPTPLRARAGRTTILVGMGRERTTATITYGNGALLTSADRTLDPQLYAHLEDELTAIAAGYEPRKTSSRSSLVSVHPVGGASIGVEAEEGVVDHTGQVFGHPGLYVADASLYPLAPGCPPSMTIAALAERQAELMAA